MNHRRLFIAFQAVSLVASALLLAILLVHPLRHDWPNWVLAVYVFASGSNWLDRLLRQTFER